MDSVVFKGVLPVPNAAVEVIAAGSLRVSENRAVIYDSVGNLIDQETFQADSIGNFRFYCEGRVDIYYGDDIVPTWSDVLVFDIDNHLDNYNHDQIETDITALFSEMGDVAAALATINGE